MKSLYTAEPVALTWYNTDDRPELRMDVLRSRLVAAVDEAFAAQHMPAPRSYPDALRVAFSELVKRSVRTVAGDGDRVSRLDIVQVRKGRNGKAEAASQKWAVHLQINDAEGEKVGYELLGYAELAGDGGDGAPYALTVPSEMGTSEDVHDLALHYQNVADPTKLRSCLGSIYNSFTKIPLSKNGMYIVSSANQEFINDHVEPIFQDLDTGTLTITAVALVSAPSTMASVSKDAQHSVAQELQSLKATVLKAKSNVEGITASKVVAWIEQIENLENATGMLAELGVELPPDLGEMKKEIEAIKETVKNKPRAKKRIISMNVEEDDDLVLA